VTAPLVWLLLSALAVIAPPAATGPAAWQGAPPVVVARPSQPVSGHAMQVLVAGLPRLDADATEATRFLHGRIVTRLPGHPGEDVAVYSPEGRFLGVGREAPGGVAPLRLMATNAARVP